jgi:hypothetical protein
MTTISQQLIFIDSANRTRAIYPSPNNFVARINGQSTLTLPVNTNMYYKLSVENAALPYSFYNMTSSDGSQGSGNNYFRITTKLVGQSPVSQTVTFEEGNPTSRDIVTYMTGIIPGLTVSYDKDSQKFLFTATGYEYVIFDFTYRQHPNDETAHAFLGFEFNNSYQFTTSLKSVKPVNVSFNSGLFLRINNVAGDNVRFNNDSQSYNKSNVLATFNVTAAPSSVIFYQDVGNDNMQMRVADRTITELSLSITDRFGRLIKGLDDYQLCLKVELIAEQPEPVEFYREHVLLRDTVAELLKEIRALRNDNIQQFNRQFDSNLPQIQPEIQPISQQTASTMFDSEIILNSLEGVTIDIGKAEPTFNLI